MSYLPRLSKTYKEPQESFFEALEDTISYNNLRPASSLLNEKTFNPQMILRHYRYIPHAPPVLPGPSVLEELREHELYKEASRLKRSISKTEKSSTASEVIEEQPQKEESENCLAETESNTTAEEKTKVNHNRKSAKGKTGVGRKKSGKSLKKNNQSKVSVNACLIQTDKPLGGVSPDRKSGKPFGDSEISGQEEKPDVKNGELTNRSVQCTIFGSLSKDFVIPPIINSLLRVLAFLLREMNRDEALGTISAEKKSFITQIQLILGDLCNQKVEKEYGFDMTYSDFKRLEKIYGELRKYMRDVYGDKGEYIDKIEDLKKIFIELKKKEMELTFLNDKLQEMEQKTIQDVVVKEGDLKNSEITLQNKRLESEQLTAEAEFSCRELKQCQKTIAEVEWEIREFQEQIINLKKSAVSRSKTGVLARKSSILKFSNDLTAKGSRSKESENTFKKKT